MEAGQCEVKIEVVQGATEDRCGVMAGDCGCCVAAVAVAALVASLRWHQLLASSQRAGTNFELRGFKCPAEAEAPRHATLLRASKHARITNITVLTLPH